MVFGNSGSGKSTCAKATGKAEKATVTRDVASCPGPGYNLYAGPLSSVATSGYDDFRDCALGTSGSVDISLGTDAVFVVVPVDGGVEGSHGRSSDGVERPGSGVGQCAVSSKDVGGSCP